MGTLILQRIDYTSFLFVVFLLAYYLSCGAAKSRRVSNLAPGTIRTNQPNFKQVLEFMRTIEVPEYHGLFFDSNLTEQLAASRYMINIYNNLKTDPVQDSSQEFNVSNITATNKTVKGADTIMGILNDVDDNIPKTSNFHMRFKFNFTAKINDNESVELAEFHIYKDLYQYAWMKNRSFLVELFVITVPGNPSKLHTKVSERVIRGWETGWQIFDVTQTVDMWVFSPGNNYGLELSVMTLSDILPIPVDALKFGFVGFKGPFEQRPFIVSFFKGDPTERSQIIHATERKRRSVFQPGDLKYGNSARTTECKVRHMYVDFQQLSWQNWIIAPDGYESSYCYGECVYPNLGSRKNITNHAIVQSLVHLHNPYVVPSPCCAPTKLNAISVLYFDKNQNVILKKFNDMVVKACGCH